MERIVCALTQLMPRGVTRYGRTLLIKTLQQGPLPRHVGFIMDGNRRFSRAAGVAVEEGHLAGFEALKRILEWLLRLHIPHVTVYAFAIENFNRPAGEVNKLMDMARTKLVQICEKGQLLDRYGIRVVVIGRKDLLPADIRASVERVEAMTVHNTQGCLNVAFPYSSQEEMASAMYTSAMEAVCGHGGREMVEQGQLEKNLYTGHSPGLDMVIRTSGETRLSDFLLWQTAHLNPSPSVHFVPTFWPRFGFLDLLPILLGWQAEHFLARLFPSLAP